MWEITFEEFDFIVVMSSFEISVEEIKARVRDKKLKWIANNSLSYNGTPIFYWLLLCKKYFTANPLEIYFLEHADPYSSADYIKIWFKAFAYQQWYDMVIKSNLTKRISRNRVICVSDTNETNFLFMFIFCLISTKPSPFFFFSLVFLITVDFDFTLIFYLFIYLFQIDIVSENLYNRKVQCVLVWNHSKFESVCVCAGASAKICIEYTTTYIL